jgi:hypothetical protein
MEEKESFIKPVKIIPTYSFPLVSKEVAEALKNIEAPVVQVFKAVKKAFSK